ncbi:MAG TPA: OsmC family protein [Solirubrobacteraceae bacterium]|jgi:putative redox protein|nr:OsmC family protein [Solirubrobacteraceae bacterium]
MKATARRQRPDGYAHTVEIGDHELTIDEPLDQDGDDAGPTPQELLAASLAGCTAITIEMYAKRKGWDLPNVEVEAEYEQSDRGATTKFTLTIRLPEGLSDEQIERLSVIGAKCPVHRTLDGDVIFEELIETAPPASS